LTKVRYLVRLGHVACDLTGNLPPMPAVFPDHSALIVRMPTENGNFSTHSYGARGLKFREWRARSALAAC